MSSIETSVTIYVAFICSLVLLQAMSLVYYLFIYDCCYFQSSSKRIYTCVVNQGNNIQGCCDPIRSFVYQGINLTKTFCQNLHQYLCRKKHDPLNSDTKELPLIDAQLYDQL